MFHLKLLPDLIQDVPVQLVFSNVFLRKSEINTNYMSSQTVKSAHALRSTCMHMNGVHTCCMLYSCTYIYVCVPLVLAPSEHHVVTLVVVLETQLVKMLVQVKHVGSIQGVL